VTDAPAVDLKVGVALALSGDPGEMLADAKAVEAAGADSLWVFDFDMLGGGRIAQYIVMSAIAAVTWRARLVVPAGTSGVSEGPDQLAHAHTTCARIAHGRLLSRFEFVVSDAAPDKAGVVFAAAREEHPKVECWLRAPFPDGRGAWDELRRACTAAGATGVVLPNDPRLIDLLRNPDIVEDRSDLRLSFG
jgi:hypothetical protein